MIVLTPESLAVLPYLLWKVSDFWEIKKITLPFLSYGNNAIKNFIPMIHSPPSLEAPGSRESVLTEMNWKILIAGLSGAVLLFTIYCLANGIATIFMHLYYFPIILLAYHYQRKGVLLSSLLGALYVSIVAFFTFPAMQEIEGALVRFCVFVGISLVVAYLSSLLARQQISHKTLFDRAGGGILYVNQQDLSITNVNSYALNLLGYSLDELIGTALSSIFTYSKGEVLTCETFAPTMPDEYREVRIKAKDGGGKTAILSVGELPNKQYVLIITDITRQIQLQNENRQLSVLQENIIANANVWLMVLNSKGQVLIWNKAAEDISGYPAEEVIGNSSIWKQLYPDRDYRQSVTEEIVDIIQADNYLRNFETVIISKNGENKNIMWNTRALSTATASGEKGFVAIGVDITALKKSELEFNAIFNQTFQLVGLLDPDGTVLKLNKAVLDFEDISEVKIYGKPLWETPWWNHPQEMQNQMREAILHAAQGEHIQFEVSRQRADGIIHTIDFSIKPVKDKSGNVIFLIPEGWDITRLKETEAALRESENKFHQIFDKANDGIEIIELRDDGLPGKYIDVNETACRMVQYTRDEMLRMSPLDISTDYFSRPFDSIIKEVQTLGKATFETEHRRKDGSIVPVEASMLAFILFEKRVVLSIIRDITERKMAEEALQESEHRNAVLIDALPDMMFTISREGIYLDFKVSDSDVLAIPADQIIGKSVRETGFTKESADTIMLHIEEAIRTKTLQQFEYDLLFPHGIRNFEARMVALNENEVLGIVRDITDRKQAELELQKLASIVQHSGELVSLATPDGMIIFLNEAGSRMVGITPDEAVTHSLLDCIPEHLKEKVESELLPLWIEQGSWEGDLEILNYLTNKSFDVHTMIFTIKDPATGELRYLANVSQDITDRKKAEMELQRLASIVQHSGEFIVLSTPDCTSIFINKAGARMLGTTPEEAISHPILYFIPEHLKEKVESELLPIWKEQDAWEGDLQYINNSTGKLFDVHTLVFKIKDPATGEVLNLVNVSQNITDRKRAEIALQEVNKKLNLLSSITRHDIINEVSAAEMLVDLMEMEGEIPPDSKIAEELKTINEILKMIERQIVFTRDYQDLGVQSPNWQNVGGIIDETAPTLSNGLAVKNEVGTLEIYADPLFEKVIYNLFDNAARYGEKITTIRFFSEETTEGLKLICEDDGVGVPADVKKKIFNRQYFQHTGLGLFLSQEILSITGMTIAETGEPGVGARFEISVPKEMWRPG